MVQLSHPYVTTEKKHSMTIRTFVSKPISVPLNMLSRFVIAFLQRSKHFFFFLNFMASVTVHSDFGPKKIKFVTASTFSPSICHEVMVLDGHDLCFFNIEFEASFR